MNTDEKGMYGQGSFHHKLDKLFGKLPFTIEHVLAKNLARTDTVLDIGCGPASPLINHKVEHSVGVDIFPEYIQAAREKKTHNEFILADCTQMEFPAGSFDVILALDSLEHLTKEQSYKLLEKMKTWARRKIIIAVPNGTTPGKVQDNNPYQKHESGYSVAELKDQGFDVRGIGIKLPGYESNGLLFYLIRYGSYPFRLVTYYRPNLAHDLIGIFDAEKNTSGL